LATDIYSDLFIATHGKERDNGIAEDLFPSQCQTSCYANHILFGYSYINKLFRKILLELFDHAISQISDEKHDVLIFFGFLIDVIDNSVSHAMRLSVVKRFGIAPHWAFYNGSLYCPP